MASACGSRAAVPSSLLGRGLCMTVSGQSVFVHKCESSMASLTFEKYYECEKGLFFHFNSLLANLTI